MFKRPTETVRKKLGERIREYELKPSYFVG